MLYVGEVIPFAEAYRGLLVLVLAHFRFGVLKRKFLIKLSLVSQWSSESAIFALRILQVLILLKIDWFVDGRWRTLSEQIMAFPFLEEAQFGSSSLIKRPIGQTLLGRSEMPRRTH